LVTDAGLNHLAELALKELSVLDVWYTAGHPRRRGRGAGRAAALGAALPRCGVALLDASDCAARRHIEEADVLGR